MDHCRSFLILVDTGILDNKTLLSHNHVFNFRATFSSANNRLSARSENSTDWKLACNHYHKLSLVDVNLTCSTTHFVMKSILSTLQNFENGCIRQISGGFRGCSRGQLPPFMMKTRLGAPFSVRSAPLILTQKHSFFMFRSEYGKHICYISYFIFESFKEGCPSAEAVFQGTLR